MKKIFLFVFVCMFITRLHAQQLPECNNWLFTPTIGSTMTIGDLDVTGDHITVEALVNIAGDAQYGIPHGGKLISKHSIGEDINYSLLADGCEITTTDSGYQLLLCCEPERNITYHIAMVYDGVTLKFYRNGFLMKQKPCTGNLATNNLTATIAQLADMSNSNGNQFSGYINEIRIWNIARTQEQIRAFMSISLPSPTTQTGLLAYYTFDNLLNKQGNTAWNGTLNNGATINETNPDCQFVYDSCGTIVDPPPPSNCSDTCYWKVSGNAIVNGYNILGTLTNNNVRVQTNGTDRGILTASGRFGWNTTTPTTTFTVNSDGHPGGVPSGVRIENLDEGEGTVLVIDENGYLFNSNVPAGESQRKLQQLYEAEKVKVEALQEQVNALSNKIDQLINKTGMATTITPGGEITGSLLQNTPNPFDNTTKIEFSIKKMKATAWILITDLSGKEIKKISINSQETRSVSFNGTSLPAGIYIYSLIIDNKIADSKQMALSK